MTVRRVLTREVLGPNDPEGKETSTRQQPERLAEPLLTIKQAAERLALSPLTLYAWISRRQIPHRRLGRQVRFSEDDLAAIVERVEANECPGWRR